MRAARRAFVEALAPGERAALEAALCARLRGVLPDGAAVAGYSARGAEIDAQGLGRPIALPWFAERDGPMRFRLGPACAQGPWGPQPADDASLVEPGIVLAPLVAAGLDGTRLGQGGGHYDRAVDLLRRTRPVLLVGLAWDVQILPSVPAEPWDAPLSAIVTPSRWLPLAAWPAP